ncbi:MAG: citramalate synthase [Actinomyces sp.]|jgi:2-isopropylmalate synthase|nr:citramalate synthase [Actinomyces sp.]MCI1641598.1 citramalate synthase [Actinomyces sp.]MCI1661664.1 citramalate synthase [Actinomyces sp.]MCI1691329.1 citramalate synthase [Actinomyces sp.]
MEHVVLYDTTLRDGAQQEGISLSVADKLAALRILDDLGVDVIEGGWPGAIPKDTEFFRAAARHPLVHARLAAFGATVRPGADPAFDPQVAALRDSGAPIITLVAKSDPRHVERALRTTREENLRMVTDTVAWLSDPANGGAEVMVDLEHFFDGLAADPDYGIDVMLAAARAGAGAVIPCDTNGGNLPGAIARSIARARTALDEAGFARVTVGIHTHNDAGCAVANALAAVEAGARHVQGTINGYGERTGNANLLTCLANLQVKMGYEVVPADSLARLGEVSRRMSELTNIVPFPREPYTGASAFAHKAGLHASAIRVDPGLYQHVDPETVGNGMRMLVSEMAGRSSIELKARELGVDLAGRPGVAQEVARVVKEREAQGYTYDAADASFELLLRDQLGLLPRYARVESWKVTSGEQALPRGGGDAGGADARAGRGQARTGVLAESEATVKIHTGHRHIRTAEGNGPVNALDNALRAALARDYPEASATRLTDFRVRILDPQHAGTDATIRVLISLTDGTRTWSTVGVGTDVIEASWEALFDGYWWGLAASGVRSLLIEL